jgi:hypothetical protein
VRARIGLCLVIAAFVSTATGLAAQRAYRVHTISGYGISLSLPSAWKALDSKHVLTPAQLQQLEQENPELAGALSAMTKPNPPVKFFAFDPVTRQDFATNVNVVVVPLASKVTFDRYAKAIASEIGSLSSVSNVSVSRVKLPAGRAVRISYRVRFTTGGKTRQTATLQYGFLPNAMYSVVFTYTTLPQLQSRYAPVFASSAKSIRFG